MATSASTAVRLATSPAAWPPMPSASASSGPRSHESSGVVRTRAATKSSLWSRNGPGSDTIPHENLAMTAPARIVPLPTSDGSGSAIALDYRAPMANDRKRKGGRVTPKAGDAATSKRGAAASGPTGQVGKRPSSPVFLVGVAVAWIACGIAAFFLFSASWRIVVGVVFIGVGLYWLRGAMATIARHEERLGDEQ